MFIKQLSVFVENKPGRAAALLQILADNHVNIRALSIAEASEFGILRMIVDDPERGKQVLKENGITVKTTDVIAAAIDDTPGGLSRIVNRLRDAGISIEYLYAFVAREQDCAHVVLRVDQPAYAEEVLSDK